MASARRPPIADDEQLSGKREQSAQGRKLDSRSPPGRMDVVMQTEVSAVFERLTWDEICRRFPDEWVVLVETDWVNDTDFTFGTAVVVAHHKRRKQASPDIKAAFLCHDEVGCFWTGEISGPVPRFGIP